MEEPTDFVPWAQLVAKILQSLHAGGLKSSTNYMACICFGFVLLAISMVTDLSPLGGVLEISGDILIFGGVITWLWFLANLARKADA